MLTEYVHGPGIDEPIAMLRNNQTYYYHADGLGSIIAITDSIGRVVQRYEYDSFGNITYQQDPNFLQPYTYTGREYDPESGLYYYRARYYDAKVGRFISEDPIGFDGGINFYSYVGNDPINYNDPTGENPAVIGAYVCLTAVGIGFINWWYYVTHPPKPCDQSPCFEKPPTKEPKIGGRPQKPPEVPRPPKRGGGRK